ncbi:MAG TPA: L-glutamate gamma-semialdehyde dehydrogenase, partial [Bacteroidota bacterium]
MPKENQATAKITYATTGAEQANGFHEAYDRAIEQVGQTLGRQHPMYIDGQHVLAKEQFNDRSPIDTRITVGAFQKATREHVKDAIIAARQAYPEWSR